MLESKLKDSKIKETKARVAKEFLSVQLALKNVNNISHIEKIRSLEAGIEKREASEEEKLALLNRQKEVLGLLWKREREMKSKKSSGALMEKRIEDLLRKYSVKLEVPEEEEEMKLIHDTQDQVYNLVRRAKTVADLNGSERKRKLPVEEVEFSFTTSHSFTKKMVDGCFQWVVKEEERSVINNLKGEQQFNENEEIELDDLPTLPSLDETLSLIRRENMRN